MFTLIQGGGKAKRFKRKTPKLKLIPGGLRPLTRTEQWIIDSMRGMTLSEAKLVAAQAREVVASSRRKEAAIVRFKTQKFYSDACDQFTRAHGIRNELFFALVRDADKAERDEAEASTTAHAVQRG